MFTKEYLMKMKTKVIVVVGLILMLVLTSACSGSGAECSVVYKVKGGRESLDVVINPPGEEGDFQMDGGLQRNMYIGGNKPVEIEFKGALEKTFQESGNTYQIDVLVKAVNDKLSSYTLKVTGGVYGDTPHICSK
jgi:hypothetical protein